MPALTLSSFMAEVINILRFHNCNSSSLQMFRAKSFFFTVTFIINTLYITINQKSIIKIIKDIMYG